MLVNGGKAVVSAQAGSRGACYGRRCCSRLSIPIAGCMECEMGTIVQKTAAGCPGLWGRGIIYRIGGG